MNRLLKNHKPLTLKPTEVAALILNFSLWKNTAFTHLQAEQSAKWCPNKIHIST